METKMESFESSEVPPERTAREMQQFLGSLSGSKDVIPWDLYSSTDQEFLKDKIKLLIPDVEETIKNAQNENKKLEKTRESLVNKIWLQRKYYGGNLLMSIFYVLCTKKDKLTEKAKYSTEFSIYPVFRVRKCYLDEDSTDCCMIFVDDNSRVYKHWDDYKRNNTLPEGIVIAPKNGVYNFDDGENIILECFESPACKLLHKAGNYASAVAGGLGLCAAAVSLSALALPIAAPILAGTAAIGIGSSAVVTGTSISRMVDRGKHDETLDPTKDSQARSDWIGVVGGVVGLGASGASAALAKYAATGRNVTNLVEGTVNSLNVATIAINGVGVGNGILEIVLKKLDGDNISILDVAQLGVSLFLVTHSVYNFQTASKIVTASRDKSIDSFRQSLSKRQKKAFERAFRETVRLRGVKQGKMDVIRALNNMPESKQPLNDLFKINKHLNQNDMKASLQPDGKILLNNDLSVDSATLRNSFQHQNGENIVGFVGPVPQSHATGENLDIAYFRPSLSTTSEIRDHVIRVIGQVIAMNISSSTKLADCIRNIGEHLATEVLDKLCRIVKDFIEEFGREMTSKLGRFVPFEQVLWYAFEVVVNMCGCKEEVNDFIRAISGRCILLKLKAFVENMAPTLGEKIKCKLCRGYYSMVPI